ncbi:MULTISPECIES: hypothetical protein [unclassified Arthrobacter]|uniref:Antitoxin SocA-like Panacea domain-containing protein n=1 Tax=Arthrobacter sp. AK-1 TaxID=415095 RepID=A6YFK8_9MICC|nr:MULTISPECIES: hypothetical protein [unclassified Arthrobacter]ABR67012.1 hypothetical protein [Arthrobacter sp. AK-1]
MESPEFDVDDAIVLLLGSEPGQQERRGEIRGITRLEKLVFLMDKETSAEEYFTEDPEFEAYNFGPFSSKVYKAVDTLVEAGLVEDSAQLSRTDDDMWESEKLIGGDDESNAFRTRNFRLTPLGQEYFDALQQELPAKLLQQTQKLRKQFSGWPLRDLVRYVYQKYESYTSKSLIRDDILGPRRI